LAAAQDFEPLEGGRSHVALHPTAAPGDTKRSGAVSKSEVSSDAALRRDGRDRPFRPKRYSSDRF
jgi:hypothetical protein